MLCTLVNLSRINPDWHPAPPLQIHMCAPSSRFTRSGAVNPRTPVTRALCRGLGDARAAGPGEPWRWPARLPQGARRCAAVEGQLHPRVLAQKSSGCCKRWRSPGTYGLRCKSRVGLSVRESGLNILVQQVSSGLALTRLPPLKCKRGHGRAGSLTAFTCGGAQGKAISQSRAAGASLQSCSQPGCRRKNTPINS